MKPVYKIVCLQHEHLPDHFFVYAGYLYTTGFRYSGVPVVSCDSLEKARSFCLRNEIQDALNKPLEYADVTYGHYHPEDGVTRFEI